MNYRIKVSGLFFIAICFSFLNACNTSSTNEPTDNATSGNIQIAVDETLKPIIDSELMVFHALYKNAHISVKYLSESDCLKWITQDSVKTIIIPRMLTSNENVFFESKKYFPKQTKICVDAIAIIVNNSNIDTLLTPQQMEQIMNGNIMQWKQISSLNRLKNIQIVFDNPNGSTLRYLKDSLLKVKELPKNVFALQNNAEVINYVEHNKNALGIIGVNWCKDKTDSTNLKFTTKVKVVGIKTNIKNLHTDFPQPHQMYIKERLYPYTRNIYTISKEARSGLGTGFIAFLASDKGQRIILKSGLVPSTMPIRILSFNKNKTF
jgi:phosphate transport system substrate-binding protein